MALPAVAALGLAAPAMAVGAAPSAVDAATAAALDKAMTPGAGQKRLDAMVGKFNVAIRAWATPAASPVASNALCTNVWTLGGRYLQSNLSGFVAGAPFNGIGYIAYDNSAGRYQATWMDTGSTAQTWYTGGFKPGTKSAVMKASTTDPVTGKPSPLELRMTIDANGNHKSELWGTGTGKKLFKMLELTYTRVK
jgi:hypothetical protein